MKHVKIIKKGNDAFGILKEERSNKTYTMKTLGNYLINEIPNINLDISSLPGDDRATIGHYINKGMRHHAKRNIQE